MPAGLHLDPASSTLAETRTARIGLEVLPTWSHRFLQRMLMKLQTLNLQVAGSNPAGRKTVAQLVERVPVLRHRQCFIESSRCFFTRHAPSGVAALVKPSLTNARGTPSLAGFCRTTAGSNPAAAGRQCLQRLPVVLGTVSRKLVVSAGLFSLAMGFEVNAGRSTG